MSKYQPLLVQYSIIKIMGNIIITVIAIPAKKRNKECLILFLRRFSICRAIKADAMLNARDKKSIIYQY